MASKYPPGASELAEAAIDGIYAGPTVPGKSHMQVALDVVDKALEQQTEQRGRLFKNSELPGSLPNPVPLDLAPYRHRQLVPGGMVYVVVLRNVDLPLTNQKVCMTSGNIAVQVGHVIAKLAQESNWDVAESGIALLSVADSKDLLDLAYALTSEGTAYVQYLDEGKLYGDGVKVFTALATHPIQKHGSAALKKLQSWKCACNNDDRNERLGIREKPSKPDDVSRPSRDRDDVYEDPNRRNA